MQVDVHLSGSNRLLARIDVDELQAVPQPGLWLDWGVRSFLVLQRRHRYQLKLGRYHLASIALEVREQHKPQDAQWWKGRWVIGNPSCLFNARSPLLRCAVLPEGPCTSCSHFKAQEPKDAESLSKDA